MRYCSSPVSQLIPSNPNMGRNPLEAEGPGRRRKKSKETRVDREADATKGPRRGRREEVQGGQRVSKQNNRLRGEVTKDKEESLVDSK